MDNIVNTTNIDDYDKYLNQFIKFKNYVQQNDKKKIYNLYKIFDSKYIEKLKIDNKYLNFKSDEKPKFEYTKDFNELIILKNNKFKQYLIIEINLPYLNLLNKDIYNEFTSKNYFFHLINNKNKIIDDIIENEEFNKIKQLYENDKININKYNNNISNDYDKLFNLYIKELNINSEYNKYINLYNQDKDKDENLNIITFLNLFKNNYHYRNKNNIGKIYDNNYYIKDNNTLVTLNDKIFKNQKYNKISKSKITNPIHDNIIELKKELNSDYLIDYSNIYDDNYNSSITFNLINDKKYNEYISDNLLNNYSLIDNNISIQKNIKKEIITNIDENKFNKNLLVITNNNIELEQGEYLDETYNKISYNLKGFKWRNYLDNKNTNYTFVYKNLLWNSVNHCIQYLISNDDKYSIDYDYIYYKNKDNNNYIGYSENIIDINIKYDDKDIILNKILQNNDLINILLNTKDSILVDENNNELTSLMEVRKLIKNKKNSNDKDKYFELHSYFNDSSNIILNYLNVYKEDTEYSKEIINEIKELKLYNKYKDKINSNLFEIVKYNYLL